MRLRHGIPAPALAALGLGLMAAMPAIAAPVAYTLQKVIAVPTGPGNTVGGTFKTYDIGFFDASTQNYYLADRSNASVDVFSAKTDTFVTRINGYAGQVADNGHSGPDGVLVVNANGLHQLYAGDGNSTINGYTIGGTNAAPTFAVLPGSPISSTIGGAVASGRIDEMAYSPVANTILAANNAAVPTPFSSIFNVSATPTLASQTVFDGAGTTPNAAGGIEQPAWNATTGTFWVSIVQIGNSSADPGGISEVNATTGAVIRTISFASLGIASCGPTGLMAGPAGKMAVVCGNGGTQTLIIDPTKSGAAQLVASISQTSGGDEGWYDPTTNLYFLADRNNNPNGSAPVLGIINALTNTFVANVATTPSDHSVAVDPVSGQVFVAAGGVAGNSVCPTGCILVFGVPEPGSLPMLAVALFGFYGLIRFRRA